MTVYAARDLLRVPGLLSLSRIPLGLLFAWTVRRRPRAALAVLAVAGFSDVLDGWYARRFEQATPTGAVVDAVADKLFVGMVVAALIAAGALSPARALLLSTRELGELAIGARLAIEEDGRLTRPHVPHPFGKVTTLLQYAAAASAILRSPWGIAFAVAAAEAGALATAAYWLREARAVVALRRGSARRSHFGSSFSSDSGTSFTFTWSV